MFVGVTAVMWNLFVQLEPSVGRSVTDPLEPTYRVVQSSIRLRSQRRNWTSAWTKRERRKVPKKVNRIGLGACPCRAATVVLSRAKKYQSRWRPLLKEARVGAQTCGCAYCHKGRIWIVYDAENSSLEMCIRETHYLRCLPTYSSQG